MKATQNSAPNSPRVSFCPACGAQVQQPDARFCNHCGTPIAPTKKSPVSKPKKRAAKRTGSGKKALLAVLIVLAVLVAAAIVLVLLPHGKKDFGKLYPDYRGENWCLLSEDGSKISLIVYPEDAEDSVAAHNAACQAIEQINKDLGFDDDFLSMAGYGDESQRTVENDRYIASWYYGPTYGLVLSYEFK